MEANKILSASLLDLLFESRNKAYGAYELRTTYHRRIRTALFIAGGLVLLLVMGSVFARSLGNSSKNDYRVKAVTLIEIPPDAPEVKVIPPPQRPPEQTRSERLTNIVIVPNDQVDEPPPTQDELRDARIDIVKGDGPDETGITPPDVIDEGKGLVGPPKKDKPDEPFTSVEVDAAFPGGAKKWQQFLERNCNGQVASDNGAPVGKHTVVIRFVVDEQGQVSDIRAMTSLGHGMEEEAIKVIRKAASMKWTPAFQNGVMVKAYRTQPIVFVVEE